MEPPDVTLADLERLFASGPASYCPPVVHPKQRVFLDLDCDEALYGGAAGGGKSEALLRAALQYIHIRDYAAILFRRTFADLALPGALMDRAHEWLGGTAARWHDRDKTWAFPSGATLTFGYMDGPRDHMRYKSAEFQFVGFDELTEFLETQYTYLFSRMRRKDNMSETVPLRMRAATNPGDIGHEWVGARWNIPPIPDQSRIYEHEGRVFVPARAEDNPSLDLDSYARMLSKLNPVTCRQLREGHWIRDTSGLVYSAWDDARNTIKSLPADQTWHYILGCDFGVVDPTAFVVLAFSQYHPTCYVVRSEQWRDMHPSAAAEKVKEWQKDFEFDCIVGDVGGLGKAYQSEWQHRFYLPLRAASKADKLGFVKLLNGDLANGRLLVLPGNEELIRDLRTLAWSDEKCTKEHPALPNHLPDALLYGWREARHWDWEEEPTEHLKTEAQRKMEWVARRKERIMERNRRINDPDDNDWILG